MPLSRALLATPPIRRASVRFGVLAGDVGWSTDASAMCEQERRRHPLCSGSRDRGRSRTERARPRSGRRIGGRRIQVPSTRVPPSRRPSPLHRRSSVPPKLPQRRVRTSQSRQRDEAVKSWPRMCRPICWGRKGSPGLRGATAENAGRRSSGACGRSLSLAAFPVELLPRQHGSPLEKRCPDAECVWGA